MKKKRKQIISLLMILVMIFTYAANNYSFTAYATEQSGETCYTVKGEETKFTVGTFAQNTDDWAWMSMGNTQNLLYQDKTDLNSANTTDVFANANASANFGLQISDGKLAAGDASNLKFHVGTVTVKADGYDDLIINLSKDYSESYLAQTVSWGLTGNSTQILLNDYLPKDATEKTNYLHKITGVTADVTLSEYQFISAAPVAPVAGENCYTKKGEETKVTVGTFAQNTTSDWAWMSMGNTQSLLYQDRTDFTADNTTDVFATANASANFGLQIFDGKLAAGDASNLKFHVGTVTVKADGYADLIINLNKDYSESYLAQTVSWGVTGNNTQILLNDYLPKDSTEKTNYLHKINGVTADVTLSEYQYIKATPAEPEFPADYTHPTEMRDISAMDLVKDMKVGWNLGNTLEAKGGETGWGNPVTTKKMIDELKKAGFNTVRIPVRWDEHYTDNSYTIDPEYMKRVETVANYALANGMYAIINIHHNKSEIEVNEESKDKVLKELDATWKQIGNNFKDYGDKLIFETINEPINGNDWIGNTALYEIVNQYNAKALSTIRATGGNNTKRLVMLPTYAASSGFDNISNMSVPADDHVAVSIHAYLPYNFAMNPTTGSQATFGDSDKLYLDKVFRLLDKIFVKKGVPVVIGEFAADNKNNLEARAAYAKYYVQTAASYGMPSSWWDNGIGTSDKTDSMGVFDRKNLKFVYPEIVQAMLDGWNTKKDGPTQYDENVLFSGTATSSNWGQAVSLSMGLDFVEADFTDKLIIAVEYTSKSAPELILQNGLKSPDSNVNVSWIKVSPAVCRSNGTTNIAYYTLKDMASAYKNALKKANMDYDSYGKIFPALKTIYIGDTGSNLKVTKVYKLYMQKLEETVKDTTINETNKTLYVDNKAENTTKLSVTLPVELQKAVEEGLSTYKISFKSSNDMVAKVSDDGKITATGIGTATITTTVTVGELTTSFTTAVEVKNANGKVIVTPPVVKPVIITQPTIKPIVKVLPQTGSAIDFEVIIIFGTLSLLLGSLLLVIDARRKKLKKQNS